MTTQIKVMPSTCLKNGLIKLKNCKCQKSMKPLKAVRTGRLRLLTIINVNLQTLRLKVEIIKSKQCNVDTIFLETKEFMNNVFI